MTVQNQQNNPLENPIIYLPVYFAMMTKLDIKIFKLLYWSSKNLKEIKFAVKTIANKCKCSERTVQRFKNKYKDIFIRIISRKNQTDLIEVSKLILYYIQKNGGFKIIEFFDIYKERLINIGCKDPNSKDLDKCYKQDMNKKSKNLSPPNQQKCHPSLTSDYQSLYTDEIVLLEKFDFKNNEILMKFGLNEQQTIKVKNLIGNKFIKLALDDGGWYKNLGEEIYNPFGFICSRAREHMKKEFLK